MEKMEELKLEVLRYNSTEDYTDGMLFVDGVFECFTIEDAYRAEKIWGKTRIQDGTYVVELRTEGGFHNRYDKRYKFHEGMLWIKDVPNFEYILIHCGNTSNDTAGCLILGSTAVNDQDYIGDSRSAYINFYPKVIEAMEAGIPVTITYQTIG